MWQVGNKADEVELGTKSSTFMWTLRIAKEVLAYKLAACTLDLDEVSPHTPERVLCTPSGSLSRWRRERE